MGGGGGLSWFAYLVETYNRCADAIGISDSDGNVLLPPNHMAANSDICITVDGGGEFRWVEVSKMNIVIPCTEDSASRSGQAVFPHPLHDQLGYLALDKGKCEKYLIQLSQWSDRHPKVAAVYKYLSRGTIVNDLRNGGIIVDVDEVEPLKKSGVRKTEKERRDEVERLFIRFAVDMDGDFVPHLWEDKTVGDAWSSFCTENGEGKIAPCYATGKVGRITWKHPKGINPKVNGAKLVSCNTDSNFRYRGRFTKPEQANAINVEASHQAHSMLKHLIATQGYKCDTQAVIAWTIEDGSRLPNLLEDSLGLGVSAKVTDRDVLTATQIELGFDYARNLRKTLHSKGSKQELKSYARRSAILAVDAATTGRMSVTFYQEMLENEFIERICSWHDSCKWLFYRDGREYISAPSGDKIISTVYGEPKGESYNKIKKQARERLLHFIACEESIDRAWIIAALHRASNPLSYDNLKEWQSAASVACAIARKHYIDKKEVFALELEKERTDRDYLYGRLLAIADRLESHAHYVQTGKSDTEKRPTNAVRYMQRFAVKPFGTWGLLFNQLNPYIQRLDGAEWYQKQIDDVISLFEPGEFENDKPLSAKYLMGYSLQRRELFKSNKEKKETANELDQEN